MFIFSVIACFVSVIVKLLVAKARPLNDLYCVEWDIKLYSLHIESTEKFSDTANFNII